jgi:hypothetical protein
LITNELRRPGFPKSLIYIDLGKPRQLPPLARLKRYLRQTDLISKKLDLATHTGYFDSMKYLLSKSDDDHVVIAEVPDKQKKTSPNDFFVSKCFINANLRNSTIKEITNLVEWEGKVWLVKE